MLKGETMSRLMFLKRLLPLLVLISAVACCATARADYASAVLADNPIGYWRLNETATDTAVNAGTSGTDLNGTYINGTQGVPGPDRLADGTVLSGMARGTWPIRSATPTNTSRCRTRS